MPPPVAARSRLYRKRQRRQPPPKQAAAEQLISRHDFFTTPPSSKAIQRRICCRRPTSCWKPGTAVTEQSSAGITSEDGRNCHRYHRNGTKKAKQNGCFSQGKASENRATIRIWRGCFTNQNIQGKTWRDARPWARRVKGRASDWS
jgi:hypothetical protein